VGFKPFEQVVVEGQLESALAFDRSTHSPSSRLIPTGKCVAPQSGQLNETSVTDAKKLVVNFRFFGVSHPHVHSDRTMPSLGLVGEVGGTSAVTATFVVAWETMSPDERREHHARSNMRNHETV